MKGWKDACYAAGVGKGCRYTGRYNLLQKTKALRISTPLFTGLTLQYHFILEEASS